MYNRLSSLPIETPLLQSSRLVAALTVGTELIHLSNFLHRLDPGLSLEGVLYALERGNSMAAIKCLAGIDGAVHAPTTASPAASARLRARASIRVILGALNQHTDYFDGSAPA
jgi:hypothetical protein